MVKDSRSETGGDFLTMRDNASLSGSRDTHGAVGGFGAKQAIAFTPTLQNLRRCRCGGCGCRLRNRGHGRARRRALRPARSLVLRLPRQRSRRGFFLELEVCPAVTIYDFQTYLGTVQHMSLGEALAQGARRAAGRMSDA